MFKASQPLRFWSNYGTGDPPHAAVTSETVVEYVALAATNSREARLHLFQNGRLQLMEINGQYFLPTDKVRNVTSDWRLFVEVEYLATEARRMIVPNRGRQVWIQESHYNLLANELDRIVVMTSRAELSDKYTQEDSS